MFRVDLSISSNYEKMQRKLKKIEIRDTHRAQIILYVLL